MRVTIVFLLFSLFALSLEAQGVNHSEIPLEKPLLEQADPRIGPAAADTAAVLAVQPMELQQGVNAAAHSAVFDEAFWRSVAAGVLVTVISAVILRVIF